MSETHVERLKLALNLDREPFSDEGVDGLFFPGGGRQELVDQLIHLCRYGSPLLLLYGENGVGKSALIQQAELRFDPSVFRWVDVTADVLADENLILQRVEEQLQLPMGTDLNGAIEAMLRYARELDGFSQTLVLVVDEAHNLSPSAVAFIAHLLSHGGRSGLRCLLSVDTLDLARLPLIAPLLVDPNVYQAVEVPPLDLAAIDEYLAYRMVTSGLSDIQFSSEQKRRIQNQSLGNIDRINIVARQVLVDHFPYDKNRKKPITFPWPHFIVGSLVVVLVGLAYWLIPRLSDSSGLAETVQAVIVSPADIEPTIQQEHASPGLLSGFSAPMVDQDRTLSDEAGSQMDVVTESASVPESTRAALDTFADTDGPDFNFSEQNAPDEALVLVSAEPSESEPSDSAASATSSLTGGSRESIEPDPKPESLSPSEEVADLPAMMGRTSSSPGGLTPREKWLMSLDKNKYTLQMLGASEESSVQKFLARYPSLKEIAYYRTTHGEREWYVVVYGVFSSKESAKQELGRLPQPLQASGPWARTLASVQQEISQRQ